MKAGMALACALLVLAGVAGAQTPAPPPNAPTATTGPTVSGVTVTPAPRKPCSPKDSECIAMVMAQVKDLYPEQLKQFCYRQQMDVMKQNMQANMAGWCDGPGLGASELCHHYVPPVVKQVCASEKK